MKKARLFLSLIFLLGTMGACSSVTAPDDCDVDPGSNTCFTK